MFNFAKKNKTIIVYMVYQNLHNLDQIETVIGLKMFALEYLCACSL